METKFALGDILRIIDTNGFFDGRKGKIIKITEILNIYNYFYRYIYLQTKYEGLNTTKLVENKCILASKAERVLYGD